MTNRTPDRVHWLGERRLRVYPRLVLGVVALAVPLYALTFRGGVDRRGQAVGSDFVAFWSAARLAVAGHGARAWSVPDLAAVQYGAFPGLAGPTAWVYPPPMLLLVAPLGLLPYLAAFAVWTALGLALFLAVLAVVVRGRRGAWPLVLAFPGLLLGVAQGQTQFVVGALLGGALLLLDRRTRRADVLAGVLVGLLVVKPHLAVLLPVVLLADRRWRAAATAGLTALGALVVGVAVLGSGSLAGWWAGMGLVGDATTTGALPLAKFVTPYAALRQLGLPPAVALAGHLVVAVATVLVVWRVWRRTPDLRLRGSAVVVGTFLVTPYAADDDLALLALPIAWLALLGLEHGWRRGERELLVAAWVAPALMAPLAAATHLTLAPLLLGALLVAAATRAGVRPGWRPGRLAPQSRRGRVNVNVSNAESSPPTPVTS